MPKEFGVSNKNVDSRRFRPKLRETPIGKAPGAGYLEGRRCAAGGRLRGEVAESLERS